MRSRCARRYRAQHHVTEAQHAATLQEQGLTVEQFDMRRADVLGTQLARVQARTAANAHPNPTPTPTPNPNPNPNQEAALEVARAAADEPEGKG